MPTAVVRRLARGALGMLRRTVDLVLILLLGVMVLLVFSEVVGRCGFNHSIASAYQAATFAQIWMVLLGSGYAARQRLHASIELVVERLPPLAARALLVPVGGLCLWVSLGGVRGRAADP